MSQQAATPTIVQSPGFLLFKIGEGKFLLFNPYVGAGNVLIDEDTTLLQALNALQYSQAETIKRNVQTMERVTTLYIKCAQVGIVKPDEPIKE